MNTSTMVKAALFTLLLSSMATPSWSADRTHDSGAKQSQHSSHVSKKAHKHHKHKKHKKRNKKRNMGSMMRIYKAANLSDAQKDTIKKIFKATKKTVKVNKDTIVSLKKQLRKANLDNSYEKAPAEKIITEITQLQKQSMLVLHDAQSQAWKVLTPEQQEKIKQSYSK